MWDGKFFITRTNLHRTAPEDRLFLQKLFAKSVREKPQPVGGYICCFVRLLYTIGEFKYEITDN
jgi:hypothetical protein